MNLFARIIRNAWRNVQELFAPSNPPVYPEYQKEEEEQIEENESASSKQGSSGSPRPHECPTCPVESAISKDQYRLKKILTIKHPSLFQHLQPQDLSPELYEGSWGEEEPQQISVASIVSSQSARSTSLNFDITFDNPWLLNQRIVLYQDYMVGKQFDTSSNLKKDDLRLTENKLSMLIVQLTILQHKIETLSTSYGIGAATLTHSLHRSLGIAQYHALYCKKLLPAPEIFDKNALKEESKKRQQIGNLQTQLIIGRMILRVYPGSIISIIAPSSGDQFIVQNEDKWMKVNRALLDVKDQVKATSDIPFKVWPYLLLPIMNDLTLEKNATISNSFIKLTEEQTAKIHPDLYRLRVGFKKINKHMKSSDWILDWIQFSISIFQKIDTCLQTINMHYQEPPSPRFAAQITYFTPLEIKRLVSSYLPQISVWEVQTIIRLHKSLKKESNRNKIAPHYLNSMIRDEAETLTLLIYPIIYKNNQDVTLATVHQGTDIAAPYEISIKERRIGTVSKEGKGQIKRILEQTIKNRQALTYTMEKMRRKHGTLSVSQPIYYVGTFEAYIQKSLVWLFQSLENSHILLTSTAIPVSSLIINTSKINPYRVILLSRFLTQEKQIPTQAKGIQNRSSIILSQIILQLKAKNIKMKDRIFNTEEDIQSINELLRERIKQSLFRDFTHGIFCNIEPDSKDNNSEKKFLKKHTFFIVRQDSLLSTTVTMRSTSKLIEEFMPVPDYQILEELLTEIGGRTLNSGQDLLVGQSLKKLAFMYEGFPQNQKFQESSKIASIIQSFGKLRFTIDEKELERPSPIRPFHEVLSKIFQDANFAQSRAVMSEDLNEDHAQE